jgi:hypothetical protein
MACALAVFLLPGLLAPPPADSFHFGIQPRQGTVYRYRQVLEATVEVDGHGAGPIVRDIAQTLKVVRKNAAGFEVLMDTDSVKLTMPAFFGSDEAGIRKAQASMKSMLKLSAIFAADGRLKRFVQHDAKEDPAIPHEVLSTCFSFVTFQPPGGVAVVGQKWSEPKDTAELMMSGTGRLGPRPGGRLILNWTLKSIEQQNHRRVAIVGSVASGEVDIPPNVRGAGDGTSIKVGVAGTMLFDCATGMLVRLDQTVTTDALVRLGPGPTPQREVVRTKNTVVLQNPAIL